MLWNIGIFHGRAFSFVLSLLFGTGSCIPMTGKRCYPTINLLIGILYLKWVFWSLSHILVSWR